MLSNQRSPDDLKKQYGAAPLHIAAYTGDIEAVSQILHNDSSQFIQLTKPQEKRDLQVAQLGSATALHYALLNNQYKIAELLLKDPQCNKIINVTNSADQSILQLILNLPDVNEKMNLIKLALTVKDIDINYINPYGYEPESALSMACGNNDMELVKILLEHDADPNLLVGGVTAIQQLAYKLEMPDEEEDSYESDNEDLNEENKSINNMIRLLLNNGANPEKRNLRGKTFFDIVMSDMDYLEGLDEQIKSKLSPIWKQSTPEEIKKAADIYKQTRPVMPNLASNEDQSVSLENTALLVQIKKERRLANGSDYDCTVLNGKEQLDSFLTLAKIRFEATKTPFQTQFIMRPREGNSIHVATGQLKFDANGKVSVFWVDTLGHDEKRDGTQANNKEIGELIHKHFPSANLYTTDIKIQSTSSGCHTLAMYISEQLSATIDKKKDLFGDLENIHNKYNRDEDGFRIIPWKECPAYTGVPRIIQSASKPQERIRENLPADQEIINKKGQNYAQAIQASLQQKGKINPINITYENKRQKFGQYLSETLERDYGTDVLKQKSFSGFTDIVNRIPPEALSKALQIELIEMPNEKWKISIPNEEHRSKYLFNLEGTVDEIKQQISIANNKLSTDTSAFKDSNVLYQYAAIRGAEKLVNDLRLELKNKAQAHHAQPENSTTLISEKLHISAANISSSIREHQDRDSRKEKDKLPISKEVTSLQSKADSTATKTQKITPSDLVPKKRTFS